MKALPAVAILMLLLCTACAGGPVASLQEPGVAGGQRNVLDSTEFEGWQAWQQILADPGIPGTDYDPHALTVNYRADADFQLSGSILPPPGQRAADRPNVLLRQDSRYEALTDHISGRFGIPIGQQVYAHGVLLASFRLPAAADGEALIAAIRAEYPGQVLDVTYSRLITADFSPDDTLYIFSDDNDGAQWDLYRCGFPEAWEQGFAEVPPLIGVVDSGCWLGHEDTAGAIANPFEQFPQASCDLLDGDRDITDMDGHGTAVCSLIGARTDNARGLAAALPGARVLPIRVGEEGLATHATVVAGCMLAAELGCRIVNLSWSSATPSRQLSQMADSLEVRGVQLVASAGNSGTSEPRWPAACGSVLGVAASDRTDSLADFSSSGDWCELSAPGYRIGVADLLRDNSYRHDASGSSLAAALVSSALGLLSTRLPAYDNAALRTLLVQSASPLSGGGPPRLDLTTALAVLETPRISLERPGSMEQQDFLTLRPELSGTVIAVELWLDGSYVMTRGQAPWEFTADLRALDPGLHTLELRVPLPDGSGHVADGFSFLRRAEAFAMPWSTGFEPGAARELHALDLSAYPQAMLADLAGFAGLTGTEQCADGGELLGWRSTSGAAWQGSGMLRTDWQPRDSGPGQLCALLSPPVRLSGHELPTLSLALRWQLEQARCVLLLSADGGRSWRIPDEVHGQPQSLSGDSQGWRQLGMDLSGLVDQEVQLLLLTQLDAGKQSAGQFIELDALGFGTLFQPSQPVVQGLLLEVEVVGAVPQRDSIEVRLEGALNVTSASYWLDCEPFNSLGPEDVLSEAILGAGLPAVLHLPPAQSGNRHAMLHADYRDSAGNSGPQLSLPLWIFDRRGDANADGIVSLADLAAYSGHYGARLGDALYEPFLDCDLDGVITELDSAAVGYALD
ncbi:MAG: S8 family serine peptidase [bacterium]